MKLLIKPFSNKDSREIPQGFINDIAIESEASVAMLLNSSEDFIFILDKKGNIINVNDSVIKTLKYSKKELLKMQVLDLHAPEQRKEMAPIITELLKGKRKSLVSPILTKDNEHIYVDAILAKGKWKNKDVFIGICRDITEHKRIEKELDESDQKLISLLEYSSDLFAIVNKRLEFEYINEEVYQEILGYSKEELLGKSWIDIIHPEDKKKTLEGIKTGFETGKYTTFIRIKSKEGKWIWIDTRGKTFVDRQGNTKAFLIGRDITEKKIAEIRAKKAEKEFRNLITHMSDVVVEVNDKGEIVFISPQSLNVFGYTPEELIGKGFSSFIHPKDLSDITKKIQMSLNSEEPISFKYRAIHKNGTLITILVKGNKVISEENTTYVGILRDISNQIEVERKLKEFEADTKRLEKISQIAPEIRFWKLIQPKKGKSVVQKTRKMLETVIDNIPISIYWKDIDLNFLGCNEYFAELTQQKTTTNIIGKSCKDIPVLKKHAKRIYNHEKQVIESGVPEYNSIESWELENKNEGWFNVNRVPLFDDELNVVGLLVTAKDITDTRIAEQKLKDSEEKYRLITETANDFISVVNDSFQYEFINESAYMRGLGYSSDELLGKGILELLHPDDRKQGLKLLEDVFDGGEGNAEARILNKKGFYRWLEVKGRTLLTTSKEKKALLIARDITERKIIQQELEKSEREISTLLNNIPDVIITVDRNKKIQFVNHVPFNLSKEEILGKNIYTFLEHQNQDVIKKAFKRVFARNIPETIDVLEFTDFWYRARFIPIIKDNELISVILIATNITDTKIASEKLKQTEDRLTSILDNSGDLFAIVNDKYKYEYINEDAYEKTLGYTSEELLGKRRLDLINPKDLEDAVKNGLFKRLAQDEVVDYELRMKTKQDKWVDIESRGQSFIDTDGKKKYFLIGRDVTFRKQAEQRIKESEEKYRHLFENSPNAIVLVSLKGYVMDCNPATKKLFGYNKEDLINKHFVDIAAYPSELKTAFIDNFKRVFRRDSSIPFEFQAYKKDKTLVWVASYLALNKLGPQTFVQAIFQDITEKKRSEQIITQEIEKLKEIDQIRNDLVRRISHELKTPLISIYSTSQHLLQNYSEEVDPRIFRLINTIHKGGKRLKLLAENLVNSLRLESKELILNLQEEDLVQVLSECIDSFTILAKERNLFFKRELPSKLLFQIDKVWLSQAISNLVSNAIKNTPERGGVLVKLLDDSNYIDISVEDTGVGLTLKEKEKLFGKFGKIERFNEDLDIDIEGSGLGLYISNEIVQLHGGKILVESKGRNKGSIFTIRLYKNNKNS